MGKCQRGKLTEYQYSKLSALDQAIHDKDVELTALYYRADEASTLIEGDIRGGEPIDGPGLLLSIIAPGEELEAASREAAEELVSRPFVPTARGRKGPRIEQRCCPFCGTWFRVPALAPNKRYCKEQCRKNAGWHRQKDRVIGNPTAEEVYAVARERGYHRCRQGHKLTAENLTIHKDKTIKRGWRPICRLCQRARVRRYDERRRNDPRRKAQRAASQQRHREKRNAKARAKAAAQRDARTTTPGSRKTS